MLLKFIQRVLKRQQPLQELEALGVKHYHRGELQKAEHYMRAAALRDGSSANAWSNFAVVLVRQQKYGEALPVLQRVIELAPEVAEAHFDLGNCYNRAQNNSEAVRYYRRALELKPELHKAHAQLVNAYMDLCDWDAIDVWLEQFRTYQGTHPRHEWAERLEPFCAVTLLPGAGHKEIAKYRAEQALRAVQPLDSGRSSRKDKRIRVGYVSADFYEHATAHLTFSLYEAHDRDRFEIYAYSTGPNDMSIYRQHIEQTCDHFYDVREETAAATAARVRKDGIDILIDMKGYTADGRTVIFAHRPAPVQVSYLGYPGTSGAPFIDYFISDPVTTPDGYESEFTEAIARLPDTYQVNDNRQRIASESLQRTRYGLPEDAFVYCSFNRLRKIDRRVFDSWMRILRRVPRSVLWLLHEDVAAEENLRSAARDRGVDPARLVFAEKSDKPLHLARHRLADLFLDTFVCNAHTGGSDALWAGLPILTCPGETFATRVGASLVSASGLTELIVRSTAEYERVAIELAENPAVLQAIRSKLEKQRTTCALFDTPRFVSNLERAYSRMHEAAQARHVPEHFAV